jgi:hypothetical protein
MLMAIASEGGAGSARAQLMNQALARLERLDPRKSYIARMRLVGRLSIDEIARVLGLDAARVARDWDLTRLWLAREVGCLSP